MIKRIIVWLIRKGLDMYPEETIIPSKHHHLHRNPRRKPKVDAMKLEEPHA
jgi:hypothetical protein